MTYLPTQFTFNELPSNTIVPSLEDEDIFIQYLNRLYEDIAFAVNNKDNLAFTFTISDQKVDIPNLPVFGSAFLIISGTENTQPCGIWALSRSTSPIPGSAIPGTLSEIVTDDGTGIWLNKSLLITTDDVPAGINIPRNFQIRHDLAEVTANFNLRIVSTI